MFPSLSLLHSQGAFQLFALLCCFRLFHFSAATFCSMRFSFAREHNEGAAQCFFFFLLKWSCSKHQHNVAHTHAHARERHRDVAVAAAAGRRDTRQSAVLNCFCLLAANCGTVYVAIRVAIGRAQSVSTVRRLKLNWTATNSAARREADEALSSNRKWERKREIHKNVKLPAGPSNNSQRERAPLLTRHSLCLPLSVACCGLWAVGCGPWMGCARWLTVDLWAVCVLCCAVLGLPWCD